MTRRVRYEVLPTALRERRQDPTLHPWAVTRNGERIATFTTQSRALLFARTTARAAWRTRQQLAQVFLKGRDGRIRDERTYGEDPPETKG